MTRLLKGAFRAAVRPTIACVVISVWVILGRWSKFVDDPVAGLTIGIGLTTVVFWTYFVLALSGFKVSPKGAVQAPRIYAWTILAVLVVTVFAALFYLLQLRG